MAHGNGALHGGGGNAFAGHSEMHVNPGEHLGVGVCTFGGELDGAACHGVAATFENQQHIVGRAATGASQNCLQGSGGQIQAAVFGLGVIWGAIHDKRVAAAGFGDKTHARAGAQSPGPTDCAFHFFNL